MSVRQLLTWLGVDQTQDAREATPLRELVETLDRLEPPRARHLARFAYLLGRVAHADRHVSPEETRAMEALVVSEGRLSPDQATVVVGLAKTSNLLFGGTADYQVALEFGEGATYEEKMSLGRCLFAVASSDHQISMAEEAEIHRVLNQLRILPEDLTKLRVEHGRYLPGRR
ncbi:MAG TPA: TerB family tellurite resistance protein [Vicinamibacterales bacterium]|nr:TerB family tellurite resistance protein [Vicinamibacterales bacterium]